MYADLRNLQRGVGMLAITALLTLAFVGSALGDESFILSKNADFSVSHRLYSIDDTLYMLVKTEDLDVSGIESNQFTLTPRGNGTPATGTFQNHLDGTFTAAFPLAQLQGATRSWIWSASLVDNDGREFHADADILVNGIVSATDVFEFRGVIETVSATEIVVSGHTILVDANTQVLSAQGGSLGLGDLQAGVKVTVTVKEDSAGNLLAVSIFVQGNDDGELETSGIIEEVSDTTIVVGGLTIFVDSTTVVRGRHGMMAGLSDLQVGVSVKLRARQLGNGEWLATEIQIRDQGEDQDHSASKVFGSIQEVGTDYIVVAGQRFEVDGDTEFEGFSALSDLSAGSRVKVEFEVMADGSLHARKIEIPEDEDEDHGDAEVEVRGTITVLTDSTLEVGGVTFVFTDSTQILGEDHRNLAASDLYSGLLVEVKGMRQADGSVVALRVKVEDDLKTEMEVKGFVEALTDTSFQVSGLWVQVTPQTIIVGRHDAQLSFSDIQVGVFVEAKLQAGLDSTLIAVRIKVKDIFGEDEVEMTGIIDSLASDAIVVSGRLFAVDANTVVLDQSKSPIDFASLSVGQMVKVKGRKTMDGGLVAVEIRLKKRIHAEAEVEGPISAIQGDTLEVAGIQIRIGPQTIFRGVSSAADLAVGQWVEIHYRSLADGSRLALRIKVKSTPGAEVEFSGAIEAISDTALTVAGVSVRVSVDTQIRAADGSTITLQDLNVGQTVKIHAAVVGDALVAREIQVRETTVIAAAIDAASGGSISLAGQQVSVDTQTLIVGRNNEPLTSDDLTPGSFVEVIAVSVTSGGLGKAAGGGTELAQRIEVKQAATVTGVGESTSTGSLPTVFNLQQNYPNPFNPSTTIRFDLATRSRVTLKVYNLLGQEVRTLLSAPMEAGSHQVVWDGHDNLGQAVASGVYIYRMAAGGQVQTRRMVLMK